MPLQSDSTSLLVFVTIELGAAWTSSIVPWLLEHRNDVSIVVRWNCWTVVGVSFFAIFQQEHGSVTAIFYHHRTLQIILIVFFFCFKKEEDFFLVFLLLFVALELYNRRQLSPLYQLRLPKASTVQAAFYFSRSCCLR